jgi:hypothetical protein
MRPAKINLIAVLTLGLALPAAWAGQDGPGIITQINRLDNTITIQQTQNGTVGSTGGAEQRFKVPNAAMIEAYHVGDKVTYSATDNGAIQKLDRQ